MNARQRFHRDRRRSYADCTTVSRRDLGTGVYGKQHDEREADHRQGSHALLKALWHHHPRVLMVAEACGRLVVRP